MKIHSNDWEMTLNNAHDPSAEYILIPIIHYEIALFIRGNRYLRGRGRGYVFGGTENQGEHISPLQLYYNSNYAV